LERYLKAKIWDNRYLFEPDLPLLTHGAALNRHINRQAVLWIEFGNAHEPIPSLANSCGRRSFAKEVKGTK